MLLKLQAKVIWSTCRNAARAKAELERGSDQFDKRWRESAKKYTHSRVMAYSSSRDTSTGRQGTLLQKSKEAGDIPGHCMTPMPSCLCCYKWPIQQNPQWLPRKPSWRVLARVLILSMSTQKTLRRLWPHFQLLKGQDSCLNSLFRTKGNLWCLMWYAYVYSYVYTYLFTCPSNYKRDCIGLVYTIGDWGLGSPTMATWMLESQRL